MGKKNNDAAAALAFMAGLLGGYTNASDKREERKREKRRDDLAEAQFKASEAARKAEEARYNQQMSNTEKERAYQHAKDSADRVDRLQAQEEEQSYRHQEQLNREADRADARNMQRENQTLSGLQAKSTLLNTQIDNLARQYTVDGELTPEGARLINEKNRELTDVSNQITYWTSGGTEGAPSHQAPAISSGGVPSGVNPDVYKFFSNPSQYDPIIEGAAKKTGLDPRLIKAVIAQESQGNINAVSPAGAKGLMQFMPGTGAEMGVEYGNPVNEIYNGANYLKQQIDRYGGDVRKGLAAYNAGAGNVDKYNGIPPFDETQNYVASITSMLAPPESAPGAEPGSAPTSQKRTLANLKSDYDNNIELYRTLIASGNADDQKRAQEHLTAAINASAEMQKIHQGQSSYDLDAKTSATETTPGAKPGSAPKNTYPMSIFGKTSTVDSAAFNVGKAKRLGVDTQGFEMKQPEMSSPYAASAGGLLESLGISLRGALNSNTGRMVTQPGVQNPLQMGNWFNNLLRQKAVDALPAPQEGDRAGWWADRGGAAAANLAPSIGGAIEQMLFKQALQQAAQRQAAGAQGWAADEAMNLKVNPLTKEGIGNRGPQNYGEWLNQRQTPPPMPYQQPPQSGPLGLPSPAQMTHVPYPTMNMGAQTATEALGFPGVQTVAPQAAQANILQWLADMPRQPVRPPLALPAPPPQGSVIPMPAPGPIPYPGGIGQPTMTPQMAQFLMDAMRARQVGY